MTDRDIALWWDFAKILAIHYWIDDDNDNNKIVN